MIAPPPNWGSDGQPLVSGLLNTLWRVGHVVVRWSPARTVQEVRGEQGFVQHVAEHGVGVAAPVAAQDGRWVVPWQGGLATGWSWAPGASPTTVDEGLAGDWGRHLAQMHKAASDWSGARPKWREDRWWCEHESLLADDPVLLALVREALDGVADGPACHGDHGPQNFHVHEGQITSFDFDNASFQPVGLDLAVPLSTLTSRPRGEALEASFFNSYTDVRPLPDGFLGDRQRWLQLRRLVVHLSRRALWSTPTPEQHEWLVAHRRQVLAAQ